MQKLLSFLFSIRPKYLLLTIAGFLGLYLIFYYPGNIALGDGAYKVRQITDLLDHQSFACHYPGQTIDANYKFFPAKHPWAHFYRDRCYYQYPFHLTLLMTPFYWLAGPPALYFMTGLFGMAVLYILLLLAREFKFTTAQQNGLLLFSIGGYGLLGYSIGISEHSVTAFLATTAVYFAIKSDCSLRQSFLPGALVGLAVFFRAESAVLFPFIIGSLFLFRNDANRRRDIIANLAAFCLLLALFIASNWIVIGHPLGLRGVEFFEEQSESIGDRFYRVWVYLFARPHSGGFFPTTPIFCLIALTCWKLKAFAMPSKIKQLLFVCAGYMLFIPLLVANEPGPQFGERFLFNIYPLFGFCAYLPLQLYGVKTRKGFLLTAASVLIVLHTANANVKQIQASKQFMANIYGLKEFVEQRAGRQEAVILRNSSLNTFFLFNSNPEQPYFLATDDEDFWELIRLLRLHSVQTISVIHSRIRGKGRIAPDSDYYELSLNLVPPVFKFVHVSEDLGNEWLEIKNYRISR